MRPSPTSRPSSTFAFRTHEDEPLRHPDTGLGVSWREYAQSQALADDGLVDATSLADGYGEPVAEKFGTAAAEPAPNTREGVR